MYTVESYDASDDPGERLFVNHGRFASAAQALAAAKELIDGNLALSLSAGRSAAEAVEEWRTGGDVPRIVPAGGAAPVHFDPFAYAQVRAQQLHKRA